MWRPLSWCTLMQKVSKCCGTLTLALHTSTVRHVLMPVLRRARQRWAALVVLAALGSSVTDAQSVLTAPEDCAEPTLQIQDATDVAVLCGGQVAARARFTGVTSLQVGVLAPSLVLKALVSDTLASLVVHSGNASEMQTFTGKRRVLEFDAGFSELHALTSLCVSH